MAAEEFVFNITINRDEKIVYIYDRMNLSDVINTVKAIDPENFDKYRLSSFEFEEECGGIITDNEDDDIDEETARNILMKLNEWKNIDHT